MHSACTGISHGPEQAALTIPAPNRPPPHHPGCNTGPARSIMGQGLGVAMAFRTVDEFLALTGEERPTPAELRLVAAVRAGERCVISGTLPEAATRENTVRAPLLRLLITGATPECGTQDYGVWLEGAWSGGALDLSFAKARGWTKLDGCHFNDVVTMADAELNTVSMDFSRLPKLIAPGMRLRGSLFLRRAKVKGVVNVSGAKIGGQMDCEWAELGGTEEMALDAQSTEVTESMLLRHIRAMGTVYLGGAKIGGQVSLSHSRLNGLGRNALQAQGMEIGRGLHLDSVRASGTISVHGANIGGQMICAGAIFRGLGSKALNAQGVQTGESILLIKLRAKGAVDLNGAKVGGQLAVVHARLNGAGGNALFGQRMQIGQSLVWRDVKVVFGDVFLGAAHVGDLADDGHWPTKEDTLNLDGFTYDRIVGDRAPAAAGRREWLKVGSNSKRRFYPQPYTQLARVLRNMGHGGEARTVLYWREGLVAAQARRDLRNGVGITRARWLRIPLRWARAAVMWGWDVLLRLVAGYGYRPFRTLGCLFVLWLAAFAIADQVWRNGQFAPNSDVVLTSAGWQAALDEDCFPAAKAVPGCEGNPANTWSSDPQRGMDWESFSAMGYALDLVVPILDLGQTDAWAPSKDRGNWGWGLWWGRWWFEAFGWLVTALGAAAVTGIMQRERE